jgi:hypothetical protein
LLLVIVSHSRAPPLARSRAFSASISAVPEPESAGTAPQVTSSASDRGQVRETMCKTKLADFGSVAATKRKNAVTASL